VLLARRILRSMPEAPRVLFVTEKHPWPLDDGGQIRSFQILRALAGTCRVTLLATDPRQPGAVEPLRALGIEVVLVPPQRRAWKTPLQVARSLFTRRPHPLPKNFSRAMLAEIRRRLVARSVDVLHLNHLDAAQYLEYLDLELGETRAFIDTHNLLSGLYAQLVGSARDPLTKGFTWLQWTRMCRYEPALLRRAERVLVCSESERAQLEVWGVERALVVPNGVDTAFFAPGEGPSESRLGALELVFTGGLDYLPNTDGARWFLERIFPLVLRGRPDARITFVGKDPPDSLRALARGGQIVFTGRVDDVRPFVRAAQVFVVPLRSGGGTRLKILEALALGLPLVSTRAGAQGLDLRDGEELLLADEPQAFAQAVLSLANDRERAQRLAASGRARVLERYDWSMTTRALLEFYAEARRA
jgi:glycosyltransferase involved in cell wall biosynthesis